MSANARHSKATPRWFTPPEWIAMARTALGGRIELDPMSEAAANEMVGAERFLTEAHDSLQPTYHWRCDSLFINPAGGLVVPAWRKLAMEYAFGGIGRAIWVGFSVEQLAILADGSLHPFDYSVLICRKRISFIRHDGVTGSPSHANYICALGVPIPEFEAAFAGRGHFTHGSLAVRSASSTEAA